MSHSQHLLTKRTCEELPLYSKTIKQTLHRKSGCLDTTKIMEAAQTQQQHLTSPSTIELAHLPPSPSSPIIDPTSSPSNAQSALPPTDTGLGAWTALFGAFLSNGLIWGFALSFGVLQEFYSTHAPFSSAPAGIPAIGTTCTGIMYLTMPLFLAAFQRWPRARQWSLWGSLPVVVVGLVGASLTSTVRGLVFCQGVLYALAGNALVMPSINYINEWFVRKKGLAIGVAIAGDGTGGVVMPLLLQALLDAVGFRWVRLAPAELVKVWLR